MGLVRLTAEISGVGSFSSFKRPTLDMNLANGDPGLVRYNPSKPRLQDDQQPYDLNNLYEYVRKTGYCVASLGVRPDIWFSMLR